jgi:hypothetical protein
MNYQEFREPSKAYAEMPFWSWNDDLDPDELRRQIRLMDEAGWGGFFMHARVGLRTPYLSQRWMACIRASVDEARQRGLSAWLYDEDKWPSGFAGGLAVANPDVRAQALVCLVDNKPALLAERMAAFSGSIEGSRVTRLEPLQEAADWKDEDQQLVQFYVLNNPLGATGLNGYTYFNPLNPAAVRGFLESTHERYAQEFGGEFAKTIPGIFTDEPAYLNSHMTDFGVVSPGVLQAVPWSNALPELFRRRWGYDLPANLPKLFFDTGDYPRVRYHFWRLVTEQFVEAYSETMAAWCAQHDLMLTGHYLLEDSLWFQTRWIGAAMPHYAHQQLPGIDKLGRNLFTPLTVKQLDSVVCQLGKPRALCESYGAAGQDLALAGRKWIGDWLYVLGVTLNNPHLSLYSMRGERKRDYPANLFYQQPWWPDNRLIADYFSRLSYILSQGQRQVDILVLHPMASAWSRYRPDSTGEVRRLDQALANLETALLGAQRDFHYGDELLLEKHARVLGGSEGARFLVGQMRYRVVIIPASHTWSAHTLRLISEFVSAGGAVLAVPPLPTEVEGRRVEQVLPEAVRACTAADLPACLDQVLPFDVRIPNHPKIWYQHRSDDELDWYFLANTEPDRGGKAKVFLRGGGRIEEWDPVTGAVKGQPSIVRQKPGDHPISQVDLDFPPMGSRLLVRRRDQLPVRPAARRKAQVETLRLSKTWKLVDLDDNAVTLDIAAIRIDEEEWSPPMYVLDAHQLARQAGPGSRYELEYAVDVCKVPPNPVYLVVEAPEQLKITVNGNAVSSQDQGFWRDISFRKLDISLCLREGRNEFVLKGTFDHQTEIESIYLVGRLAVTTGGGKLEGRVAGQTFYGYKPPFQVTVIEPAVQSGDLVRQGYPFFAGRIRVVQEVTIEHALTGARLVFGQLNAAIAHVYVNGLHAGRVGWPPYEVELGAALRPGVNRIEIELVNTLRNLLGPHHRAGGDPEGVGPAEFRLNAHWTNDYVLVPFGMDRIRIVGERSSRA